MVTTFEKEMEAYRAALPSLVPDAEGKYAVVHGTDVHVVPDFGAAIEWAFDHYEPGEFMVKRVSATEPVVHFSRNIGPCAA